MYLGQLVAISVVQTGAVYPFCQMLHFNISVGNTQVKLNLMFQIFQMLLYENLLSRCCYEST